jgi:hypothetical protein
MRSADGERKAVDAVGELRGGLAMTFSDTLTRMSAAPNFVFIDVTIRPTLNRSPSVRARA